MSKKPKIGRNDPCPCGSGKKYKNCCGATSQTRVDKKERDYFKLNKAIAYKGEIGRQREEFCISYIKRKRERFKDIEEVAIKNIAAAGEAITCQKGCSFCCLMYVEATIQECEAIVYYLYHNESSLSTFLQKYPRWREEIKRNGDLFKRCGRFWNKELTADNIKETMQALHEEETHYLMQNIPCPFLHNQICSIYAVRPYMCAAHHVTSPPDWCNPLNPNEPKVYKSLPIEVMFDCSFYCKPLNEPVVTFMPLAVYEILNGGSIWLSGIPSLEGLDNNAMNDPEVRPILRSYLR